MLWHSGIGGISVAPGHRFDPSPAQQVKRAGIAAAGAGAGAHNCCSDLTPGPGTPWARGSQKGIIIKKGREGGRRKQRKEGRKADRQTGSQTEIEETRGIIRVFFLKRLKQEFPSWRSA